MVTNSRALIDELPWRQEIALQKFATPIIPFYLLKKNGQKSFKGTMQSEVALKAK